MQDSLAPPSSTMKMFVVLALAAAAVAEPEAAADAQYISTYPYTTYGAYPYTRSYGVYPAYSSPIISSLYNRHFIAKREAEADPALVYSNAFTPYTTAAYPYSHVATPFVRTVPYVNTVASHVVPAVASHTVPSYNNPHHYTAVSNGVYGPKYVAKNGPVQHVVKREAEADPSLIYSNLASTYAVASPLTTTYNHVAPLTTYNHVATPLASNGAHAVAATTAGWTHSANVGVCTNV